MAANAKSLTNGQIESAPDMSGTVTELRAIKRLLALMLLQNGVHQKAVAKAAGIRLLTINQMAKGAFGPKKNKAAENG